MSNQMNTNSGLDNILAAARQQFEQNPDAGNTATIFPNNEMMFGEAIEGLEDTDFDHSLVFGNTELGLMDMAVKSGLITAEDSITVSEIDINWGNDDAAHEITVEQFLNMARTSDHESPAVQIWGGSESSVEQIKANTIKTGQDEGPPDVPDMDIGL